MTEGPTKNTGLTLIDAIRRFVDPGLLAEFDSASGEPRRGTRTADLLSAKRRYSEAGISVVQVLVAQLAAGELVMTGYLDRIPPAGSPATIEADRFRLASPKWGWREDTVEIGGQLYVGVRVYCAGEFAQLAAGQPDYSSNKARAACELWLRDLASNGDKEMPKGKYKEAAREKFPGLSGRGFDRAWQNAVGDRDDWIRPGRKSQV